MPKELLLDIGGGGIPNELFAGLIGGGAMPKLE